jgi:HTH-type transcriptional regulator/antitoxin HigA
MTKFEHEQALRTIGDWMGLEHKIKLAENRLEANLVTLNHFKSKKKHYEDEGILALIDSVEQYEKENFPIDSPSLPEAIKFRLEQMGLKVSAFYLMVGSHGKDVLSGKRKPSKRMVKVIHDELGMSYDVLMQ